MQKNIITILSSFSGVIIVILLGTTIAYRTNTIPELKQNIEDERKYKEEAIQEKNNRIKQLEGELSNTQKARQEAEDRLQVKLDEEEKIAREKAKKIEAAKIATEKKALAEAEAARKVAEEKAKKKASKKSKAS